MVFSSSIVAGFWWYTSAIQYPQKEIEGIQIRGVRRPGVFATAGDNSPSKLGIEEGEDGICAVDACAVLLDPPSVPPRPPHHFQPDLLLQNLKVRLGGDGGRTVRFVHPSDCEDGVVDER